MFVWFPLKLWLIIATILYLNQSVKVITKM